MVEDLYPYRDKSRQGYDEERVMPELVHLKGFGSWAIFNDEWAIGLKINGTRPASTYVGQLVQVRKKGEKYGEWQLLGKVLKEYDNNYVEFAKGGAEGG